MHPLASLGDTTSPDANSKGCLHIPPTPNIQKTNEVREEKYNSKVTNKKQLAIINVMIIVVSSITHL